MKDLYYICAQPAIPFYLWQLEVMVHNFLKNGIDAEKIHIVLGIADHQYVPADWQKFKERYSGIVVELYPDTRKSKYYVPSLRPHILNKHFQRHKYLQKSAVFYHDCDMVFTGPVDWSPLLEDDVWYLSDTISYVGASYIKSKQLNIFEEMCSVIGISPDLVEQNQANSGGAQYIMKNVDAKFWEKVEDDCENLTKYFNKKTSEYSSIPNYHPIQSWTADMWAVLWNGWLRGYETKISDKMKFCWPMDSIEKWSRYLIYHNAGVVNSAGGMFYKAQYTHIPPVGLHIKDYDDRRCSYRYVQEIIETLG